MFHLFCKINWSVVDQVTNSNHDGMEKSDQVHKNQTIWVLRLEEGYIRHQQGIEVTQLILSPRIFRVISVNWHVTLQFLWKLLLT